MSDAVVTPTEGASVVVDSVSGQSAKPAPAANPEGKPPWLDERLERERAKMLKDLGAESFDAVKKVMDEARSLEEQKKSDAQKRGELERDLKAEREQKQAMAEALGAYAKAQMGGLTDAQRAAVSGIAGDDPAKQLKTIEALRPTWASAAAPAAVADQRPKDTALAPAMPRDGAQGSPPDTKTIHEELLKSNPILAARYALANGVFDTK